MSKSSRNAWTPVDSTPCNLSTNLNRRSDEAPARPVAEMPVIPVTAVGLMGVNHNPAQSVGGFYNTGAAVAALTMVSGGKGWINPTGIVFAYVRVNLRRG